MVQEGDRWACDRIRRFHCIGIAWLFIFRDISGFWVCIGDFLLDAENPEPQKTNGDVGHHCKYRYDCNHNPVNGCAKHHGKDPRELGLQKRGYRRCTQDKSHHIVEDEACQTGTQGHRVPVLRLDKELIDQDMDN